MELQEMPLRSEAASSHIDAIFQIPSSQRGSSSTEESYLCEGKQDKGRSTRQL